jgi:hypothetical protein
LVDVVMSASQPSAPFPLQSRCEASHVGLHTPVLQVLDVAPVSEHWTPQAPQCERSLLPSTSQPSSPFPLQSRCDASHVGLHTPALHARVATPELPQE